MSLLGLIRWCYLKDFPRSIMVELSKVKTRIQTIRLIVFGMRKFKGV